MKYTVVTPEAGKAYFQKQQQGNIVMLNLLKFKTIADYSDDPHLAPDAEISGKAAYTLYMKHTLPFLEEAGGEVLFYGKSDAFLIGPEDESWDEVLLVKHENAAKFLAFANHEDYLKIAGHRDAALENSRLLPITQKILTK